VLHELLPPQSVASQNCNLWSGTSNFLIKLVISQTAILCSPRYYSKPTDVSSSHVIFILFHSSIHLSSSHTFKYCTLGVLTEFNKIHDDDGKLSRHNLLWKYKMADTRIYRGILAFPTLYPWFIRVKRMGNERWNQPLRPS